MLAKDLKKEYKSLFTATEKIDLIDVPDFKYLLVEGEGHPSESSFKEAVESLYRLAYTIKMLYLAKNVILPEGFYNESGDVSRF